LTVVAKSIFRWLFLPPWRKPLLIISLVVLTDQILKFYVKTTMMLGQEHRITDWFIIHFTENYGMAFGIELKGEYGKLILTFFRILALGAIGFYLFRSVARVAPQALITSLSLIFAGALGNIIDSVFYGKIFSSSLYQVASFLPAEGGYAHWFHGKVVDMFYLPIIQTTLPSWIPFWGGEYFIFFRPVFNIADASITTGVFYLLIFQKKIFHPDKKGKEQMNDVRTPASVN
jgi:signal peptidase II